MEEEEEEEDSDSDSGSGSGSEEEEEEDSEEEPEEESEEEEEEPPKFRIGERLFQWVKYTGVGLGLGGATLYMANECRKPMKSRLPHPSSPRHNT